MKTTALQNEIIKIAKEAKAAALKLAIVSSDDKNRILKSMAKALRDNKSYIIQENAKDLKAATKEKYAKALVDRLTLNDKRVEDMAKGLDETAALKDSVGEVLSEFTRPNGLKIKKIRVPIGVVGIIYESRPNVTSDCIGLCLKSSNAVILKGGKESIHSNRAIYKILRKTLEGTKIPVAAIGFLDSVDRQAVNYLLELDQYVDVIVPRGGEDLIHFVVDNSRIPVIKHAKGLCTIYVSDKADLDMARKVCINAKVQKPGVCNAVETLLVNKKVASEFLPSMIKELQKANVEVRADEGVRKIVKNGVKRASAQDFDTEFLDLILAVKVVGDIDEAIDHINTHGSHHSDAIITKDNLEAEKFLKSLDSATVYVNASTRFTDGYEFGFGAEVGISTDKLHARGPMGLEELTTYKYLVYGSGQIRT
jgi:glutamate-5-semialdehyde dehydrogenase